MTRRNFILVSYDDSYSPLMGVPTCKLIEELPGVENAVLVRRGSVFAEQGETYVGEFYTTEQAAEKMA